MKDFAGVYKEKQRKRIRIKIELGGKHQWRQKEHFWIEIRKESKDYILKIKQNLSELRACAKEPLSAQKL